MSPEGTSDNPFIRVDPGASFDYLYRIPADHPVGTHWYHPHHHGMVADQIFGGLGGVLLVDRGADLPVTGDRVLLVTDTTLRGDGRVAQVSAMGRQGELVLVSGQHQPTIPAIPGATQRWRIINGCTSRVLAIRLAGHELVQVAQDGTFLPVPASRNRVVLAPGNRADVVVRPTGTGRYELTAEPFERGGMGGMAFTINGSAFDPQRDDQTVRLGTIEEWTVTNPSPLAHPFHLHVWPFTVLATSDATPPSGVPQDVVLIPARGWVRLRIPFTTYSGRSVYHCHILDHEDAGMMATVNVRT